MNYSLAQQFQTADRSRPTHLEYFDDYTRDRQNQGKIFENHGAEGESVKESDLTGETITGQTNHRSGQPCSRWGREGRAKQWLVCCSPSNTENTDELHAESFKSQTHLKPLSDPWLTTEHVARVLRHRLPHKRFSALRITLSTWAG
jgi:hypothetical protein